MSKFRTIRFVVVAVLTLLASAGLLAQGFQVGSISGVATDETGGALPGVTVTVTHVERGTVRSDTTDAAGRYRFGQLALGTYNVEGALSGFQNRTVNTVRVEQDKNTDVALSLGLAAESAVITVSGEAPIIDKTNAAVNTRVSAKEYEKAPVGRSYQSLMSLAPGVVDQGGGNPNSNGALTTSNVYLFDGVDTTDTTTGTFGSNMNFEAIQEVNVYTAGVSAEYGRATGAILNVITKSGTNEFEGSLKAIASNDKWNEQNKTKHPLTGVSFARVKNDRDNIRYSGTLGGPIWRDHAWFFGAYETFEDFRAAQQTVVTNESYQGIRDLTLSNYRLTVQLAPSHNVWAKYADDPYTNILTSYVGAVTELETITKQDQGGENYAAQYTGVLSSSLSIEGMYAHSESTITVAPAFRSPLHNGAPHFSLADSRWYNGGAFDGFVNRPRDQGLLAVSYFTTIGSNTHDIKVGLDLQRLESSNFFDYPNSQFYLDESFNPFNQTFVPYQREDYDSGPSTSSGDIDTLYARDKFSLGDRFFFEVGARFEKQTGDSDTGRKTVDTTAISPRLSANFDIAGNGRTLATATAGRFYQSIIQDFSDEFASVPQQGNYNLFEWNGSAYQFVRRVETGGASVSPNLDLDPTYVDEITLGFQQQLGATIGIGIRGIYREWNDMIDDIKFFDGTGNLITNYVNYGPAEREYSAVQFTFDKRFSNNWSALANYTYSETKGNHFGTLGSPLGDYKNGEICATGVDTTIGTNGRIPCSELTSEARQSGEPSYGTPHLVNLLGTYSRPVGPVNLSAGIGGVYTSGNSFSKVRTLSVLLPNGTPAGATATYLYDGLGTDRTPSTYSIDMALEGTFRILGGEIGVKGEAFNVTDRQVQTGVSATTWCDNPAGNASCQAARTGYGLGTARGSYQAPRSYRVTALIRF